MLREVTGDLLSRRANVLCHQVNFQGVMGGGIAYAIRQRLTATQYLYYQRYCALHGENALGEVLMLPIRSEYSRPQYIANLFCQNAWIDTRFPGSLTNYEAMRKCFREVESKARERGWSVAIPGRIGCGIAGGDWRKVLSIIREVFEPSPVDVEIVHWRQAEEATR